MTMEDERNLDLMVAELEQENRLMRARNERLERENSRLEDEKFGMAMPAVYSLRKQAMKEFQERNAAEMLRVQMNQETATHIPQPVVEKQFAPSPKANDLQYGGDHYKNMGVEPWDVVDTWPIEQRIGYYRGGALKYIMRMGSKDQSPVEIAKGKHYMQKLLEVLNEQE